MNRQEPISVADPSRPAVQRERPSITAPNLVSPGRNRGLEIVNALAGAVGVLVDIKADGEARSSKEQDDQYLAQLEEIEKVETELEAAKLNRDGEGQELLTRKLLDLNKRGAQDGTLTARHRIEFNNRMQNLSQSESAMLAQIEKKMLEDRESELGDMGRQLGTGVLTTLGAKQTVDRFVALGHRGAELTSVLTEEVRNDYIRGAMKLYGMDAEQAGDFIAEPLIADSIASSVKTLTGKISTAFDLDFKERDASAEQRSRVALANNPMLPTATRMQRLIDRGVPLDKAAVYVGDAIVIAGLAATPNGIDDFNHIKNSVGDPILDISPSRQAGLATKLAENVIESFMADITPADIVGGTAMKRAASVLDLYGLKVHVGDNGATQIVGAKDRFTQAFADSFKPFLQSLHQDTTSLKFTTPEQAEQVLKAADLFKAANALADPNSPRGAANLIGILQKMEEASPGLLNATAVATPAGSISTEALLSSQLTRWEGEGYTENSEAHLALVKTLATTTASYMEHSEILPAQFTNNIKGYLKSGGSAGLEYAVSLVGADSRFMQQIKLDGMDGDILFALQDELSRRRSNTSGREVHGDLSPFDRFQALRADYNAIQENIRLFRSDPNRVTATVTALNKHLGGTIADADIGGILGEYLVVARQENPKLNSEDLTKKAIKYAEADGVYSYPKAEGPVNAIGFTRGEWAMTPTSLTQFSEMWAMLGRQGYAGTRFGGETDTSLGNYQPHKDDPYAGVFSHPPVVIKHGGKWFAKEFGLSQAEGEGIIEALMKPNKLTSYTITQTEYQTHNGGFRLQVRFKDKDKNVTGTKTLDLTQEQIDFLTFNEAKGPPRYIGGRNTYLRGD